MSQNAGGFAAFVPGFEFLQTLAQQGQQLGAAASGLPDLIAKTANSTAATPPSPADQTDPANDALAIDSSISTTNLAASLAPTGMPPLPLPQPWPMAQPLQPAATAATTTDDASVTAVAAGVSPGMVAKPIGADLPAVKVTAAAVMPGSLDALVANALRVPTAPNPASTLQDATPNQTTDPTPAAARLNPVSLLPTAEPAASTQPVQAPPDNPGTATGANRINDCSGCSGHHRRRVHRLAGHQQCGQHCSQPGGQRGDQCSDKQRAPAWAVGR